MRGACQLYLGESSNFRVVLFIYVYTVISGNLYFQRIGLNGRVFNMISTYISLLWSRFHKSRICSRTAANVQRGYSLDNTDFSRGKYRRVQRVVVVFMMPKKRSIEWRKNVSPRTRVVYGNLWTANDTLNDWLSGSNGRQTRVLKGLKWGK